MGIRKWKWNSITEMAEGKIKGVGIVTRLDMNDMVKGSENGFADFPETERDDLEKIADTILDKPEQSVEENEPDEVNDEEQLKNELGTTDPVEL